MFTKIAAIRTCNKLLNRKESLNSALKAAHDLAEDAIVNEYGEKYSETELEITYDGRDTYIKGPDFLDWWTVIST